MHHHRTRRVLQVCDSLGVFVIGGKFVPTAGHTQQHFFGKSIPAHGLCLLSENALTI
jgi:hypothetical protein